MPKEEAMLICRGSGIDIPPLVSEEAPQPARTGIERQSDASSDPDALVRFCQWMVGRCGATLSTLQTYC